ncbi:a-pheromone receptor [Niveomyces insectorum RCEF 264]|uniref:A-pheromone receptor n=1 Tax=Niveomyces insectorum RCEF 264 TaxID=1081102 RepID=A0A167NJA0_9HYPO|nr:a-pheromone receptor [Niveomyces insectorum RCEF 264]
MPSIDSGVIVFGRSGSLPVPPSLEANIVLRIVLAPLALLASWVPLTLLWKNGEFPACVYVANNMVMVVFIFVNACIWHNQDFDHWWHGFGWCDLQAYLQYALMSVYAASVCAIMRRLAQQVSVNRVTSLSPRERRHQLLVQALTIFTVPLLQIVLTVFVQGQRYGLVAANGCSNAYYPTPVFLVFFVLPGPLLTLVACYYTFHTFKRYRLVYAGSQLVLDSNNNAASLRRQRARRKLYIMVVCVLVPYTPLMVAFTVVNVLAGWPWNTPSSFHYVHEAGIVPWNSITLLASTDLGFTTMNMNWIFVVSAFVAFVFFGTSKDALNTYRQYLVRCGLGRVFPKLKQVYDPDRSPADSMTSSVGTQLSTANASLYQGQKGQLTPVCRQVSLATEDGAHGRAGRASPDAAATRSAWMTRLGGLFRPSQRPKPEADGCGGSGADRDLESQIAPFVATAPHTASSSAAQPPPPPPLRPLPSAMLPNPGLNWSTPPANLPSLSLPRFLKPSSAQTASPAAGHGTHGYYLPPHHHQTNRDPGREKKRSLYPTFGHSPPTSASALSSSSSSVSAGPATANSSANTVTGPAGAETEAPLTMPFDGSGNGCLGGTAVGTQVWSDRDQNGRPSMGPPSQKESAKGARQARAGDAGRGGLEQRGVRVDWCMTSEVTP